MPELIAPTRKADARRVLWRPGGSADGRGRGGFRKPPLILATPALAFLLVVQFGAVAFGAWYAFTDWNGTGDAHWVGSANFREIMGDSVARGALWNTLRLAFCFVVLTNIAGLALALGLHRTLRSRNILRALFFLPFVMSSIAVSFIWRYVFDYEGGLNKLLEAVGLGSWAQPWLGSPTWALWTVLVVMVWQFSGMTMAVYLAGLQRIPDELLEACAVDGASTWRRFRRIVMPLLAPSVTVNVTLCTVAGLRMFDQVIALTGGGPVGASETLGTQVWKQTFVFGRFGYGAALALVLTALIAVTALGQMIALRARERRM